MNTGLKLLWRKVRAKARRRTELRAVAALRQFSPPHRLNVGCGKAPLQGWINIDSSPTGWQDLVWDVTQSLPFPDASCALIYNEHFLEHIDVPSAQRFLSECHRTLRPAGVLRIATPSLEATVSHYTDHTWKDQPWLTKYGYGGITTRAEYLNLCFRNWGHQWLYDAEELARRLRGAGFVELRPAAWGISLVPELSGRETRAESTLVYEAVK